MSRVIGLSGKASEGKGRVAVISNRGAESEYKPIFPVDIQALLEEEAYPSLKKFLLFWTMMDTVKIHGYTRAAMSAIGRATIGAWWKLSKHDDIMLFRVTSNLMARFLNRSNWVQTITHDDIFYKIQTAKTHQESLLLLNSVDAETDPYGELVTMIQLREKYNSSLPLTPTRDITILVNKIRKIYTRMGQRKY